MRALCKALDKSWDEVYLGLCVQGYVMCEWGNHNAVWPAYLKKFGFRKYSILDISSDYYTVRDFCRDYSVGTYVLYIGDHAVCVKDGNYYDAWDSGNEVPVFYFRKER